jgi:molecular chaperone GrpE
MSVLDQENEDREEMADPEDAESLQEALDEERTRAEGLLVNLQRVQADFINYKRRSELEREENRNLGRSVFILGLLPVLDDLERAMAHVPKRLVETPWVDGINIIARKFKATLESLGAEPIKAQGEVFDPNLHEATAHEPGEEGVVVRELHQGYTLGGKVIRPSVVAVGNGNEEEPGV